MKQVRVICPNCWATMWFKNWFVWVWHSPIHWFGKRLTKCNACGQRSYMKRVK